MDEAEYPGFAESTYPDIAANYRRLSNDQDAQAVFGDLKRRGAGLKEFMLRMLRTSFERALACCRRLYSYAKSGQTEIGEQS